MTILGKVIYPDLQIEQKIFNARRKINLPIKNIEFGLK